MSRGKPSMANLPWQTVDWDLTNAQIAAIMNCHLSTVRKYRIEHTGSGRRPCYVNWGSITDDDWRSNSNKRLAERLGTTFKQVGGYRCRWGKPAGPRSPGSGKYERNKQA